MKFFEEQRVDISNKITKKILKENHEKNQDSEFIKQKTDTPFYELPQKREDEQDQDQNRNNQHQPRRIVNNRFQRQRRPQRGGRQPRDPRIPREDRRDGERGGYRHGERVDRERVAQEVREERVQDVREERVQDEREEQREIREELPEQQRQEINNEERQIGESDSESIQNRDEDTMNEEIPVTLENQSEIQKEQESKNQEYEWKAPEGLQIQNFQKMTFKLFEFLQKQEIFIQLSNQEMNIMQTEGSLNINNALEIQLILESYRRNIVEEIIDILVFLNNHQLIIKQLQQIMKEKFLIEINNCIDENNLINQDILIYYAIYQIYKENIDIQNRQLLIQQQNNIQQKLSYIINIHTLNQFQDQDFTYFFSKIDDFKTSNKSNPNKSYQIIATFLSVYSTNLEGVQVKNTDLFLQNVFNKQSWKISQSSLSKMLNNLERQESYSDKLMSLEGQLVFSLQKSITEDDIAVFDCINLISNNFYSDSSIYTESQIKAINNYLSKEQNRMSAKQQKSISEYLDEDLKIKFFFEDGLKVKFFLMQDEYTSVEVQNLPIGLRDNDLEEILSINIKQEITSVNNKLDLKKSYYELVFKSKEEAKQFVEKMNQQQIFYEDKLVLVQPSIIPELLTLGNYYSLNLQIGKNEEIKYILNNMRDKRRYTQIKLEQTQNMIQKYIQIKTNQKIDFSEYKTKSIYEIQKFIYFMQQEKVEDIFDVKFSCSKVYGSCVTIQKIIYEYFGEKMKQLNNFSNENLSVNIQENPKNSKEMLVFLSSENQQVLKKASTILTKMLKPQRFTPLQSNKEKEVFFREDFIKTGRKKYTKPYFYVFFNTINMRFEFYTIDQFNFTFLNNRSEESFVTYDLQEKQIKSLEKLMKQFQNDLETYKVKQNYFVHPSLHDDFIKYLNQEEIKDFNQKDKIFEIELQLGKYLKLNKNIMSLFVKASYLKKNEEIYNSKKSKQKINQENEMQSCKVCYDSDHIFQLSNCSCRAYCRDCLREKIQLDIQSNYASFKGIINCSECNKAPISLKDFSKLFNLYEIQSMMSQWVKCITYNYKGDSNQKQFVHCIYPKCQGIIHIPPNQNKKPQSNNNEEMEIELDKDKIEISTIICNQCNSVLCSSSLSDSKIPHHSAHSKDISCLDQYLQQRGEMPSNAKYCPSCSQVYFHESGCNHLTCYQCGEHFCSICLKQFGKAQGDIYAHIQTCEQQAKANNAAAQQPEEAVPVVEQAQAAWGEEEAQNWE